MLSQIFGSFDEQTNLGFHVFLQLSLNVKVLFDGGLNFPLNLCTQVWPTCDIQITVRLVLVSFPKKEQLQPFGPYQPFYLAGYIQPKSYIKNPQF